MANPKFSPDFSNESVVSDFYKSSDYQDSIFPGRAKDPSLLMDFSQVDPFINLFNSWNEKRAKPNAENSAFLELSKKNPGRNQTLLSVPGAEISPTLLSENQSKGRTLLG
jgi:hypothetical protein